MKKQLSLIDKDISYILRTSSRAKNLRLSIDLSGELVVTKPWFVSARQAEKFVKQKSSWVLKKLKAIENRPQNSPLTQVNTDDYQRLKERARALALAKVAKFNQFYNFDYNRIFIRNQKTRWGSCSTKKNLNYNFRITLLSERQVDYIIVHELCHLGEMNHSSQFWSLVEQTIPYYQEARKELRSI